MTASASTSALNLQSSTKEIRQMWIDGGCPIRPRDGAVVLVRLEHADIHAARSSADKGILLVRGGGVEKSGRRPENPPWFNNLGQVVAVGPGELYYNTDAKEWRRKPSLLDLVPGDYVNISDEYGGTLFQDFQDIKGLMVGVVPEEGIRCKVLIPEQP